MRLELTRKTDLALRAFRTLAAAPGRVDSPPTSMIAAPSSAIATPRATAAARSA